VRVEKFHDLPFGRAEEQKGPKADGKTGERHHQAGEATRLGEIGEEARAILGRRNWLDKRRIESNDVLKSALRAMKLGGDLEKSESTTLGIHKNSRSATIIIKGWQHLLDAPIVAESDVGTRTEILETAPGARRTSIYSMHKASQIGIRVRGTTICRRFRLKLYLDLSIKTGS